MSTHSTVLAMCEPSTTCTATGEPLVISNLSCLEIRTGNLEGLSKLDKASRGGFRERMQATSLLRPGRRRFPPATTVTKQLSRSIGTDTGKGLVAIDIRIDAVPDLARAPLHVLLALGSRNRKRVPRPAICGSSRERGNGWYPCTTARLLQS